MSVPTFSLLLIEYLNRAGISDSELARSIGVRRQTIFRWKEGLVERPRVREDVLRCAQKLRLTATERDLLLLSAGFAPEEPLPVPVQDLLGAEEEEAPPTLADLAAGAEEAAEGAGAPEEVEAHEEAGSDDAAASTEVPLVDKADVSDEPRAPTSSLPSLAALPRWFVQPANLRYLALLLVGMLALLALLFWRVIPAPIPTQATPVASPESQNTPLPTSASFPASYPTAQPDALLLLIAPFHGYTVNEQYNVAGRLQEALTDEIANAKVISVTIALWPEEIRDADYLSQVFLASDAALVIWGEYDSGRVRVNLDGVRNVTQKRDFPLSSASELITTISNTLPREIRMLALTALGRLLRNQGDASSATTAFTRALAIGPGDAKTRALLNFYLGNLAEGGGREHDLNRAIRYYNDALAENPLLFDAQYNLGTVRLKRAYLHPADDAEIVADLDAAIEDLSTVIGVRPTYLPAYQNRGIARYERNQATDLADALDDFSRVIAADANNSRAYFHRGLAAIRAGEGRQWVADFQETLALEPSYYPAYNGLCWGYALAQEATSAQPFCEEAVALDPSGVSRDSRGIVYAQLARYADAAADFEEYLEWLRAEVDPLLYERYRGPLVETWVVALNQGENPFTETVLSALR